MNLFTKLKAVLAMLCCCVVAQAQVPFEVTTITDGAFAEGTKWYTVSIGAGKLLLTDTGDATYMELSQTLYTGDDAQLWCFTGDATNGYKLHNKKAGAAKALATPATMSGTNGGTAYAVLAAEGESDKVYAYDFSASENIAGAQGYYIAQHGVDANAMNNRDGKLAFWTKDKDAGSTFIVTPIVASRTILPTDGTLDGTGNWATTFTTTAAPAIKITSNAANINKQITNKWDFRSGQSESATFTFSVPVGYRVSALSFKAKRVGAGSIKVQLGTQSEVELTETAADFNATFTEEQAAVIKVTGANNETEFTELQVSYERTSIVPEDQKDVLVTKPGSGKPPYRIPAIATAKNGNIVIAADYRHPGVGADIGMATNGRLDLHYVLSKDNGATWSEVKTLVEGKGAAAAGQGDEMWVAFGDPIAGADSESDRMIMMSCCGNVSFPAGTRERHQGIARFYSEDGGETWSEPENIAEPIYKQLDERLDGPIKAMFIGSGKMTQSKTVKAGSHYRLYCAALARINDGSFKNFVLYSDDFGGSWSFLGGVDADPIPSGGNEPKAEELPDGSVIISSRTANGRRFNIFHFTNSEKAEGYWGTMAFSGKENNGTEGLQDANGTNGEILIVPVTRKEDNKAMFLVLQSLPFGPQRSNVGIYYKGLSSLSDFAEPEDIAKDWEGRHQASYLASAYSTMTLQNDNTIGFTYEETTYGGAAYTIVYKNYTIEKITDGAYAFRTEAIDLNDFVRAGIDKRVGDLLTNEAYYGTNVGQYKQEAKTAIQTALDTYKNAPTKAGYEALNNAIKNADRVQIEEGKWYRLRNNLYPEKNLQATAAGFTGAQKDEKAENQVFQFRPNENGTYSIYSASINLSIGHTVGTSARVPAVRAAESVGNYQVWSSVEGKSNFTCTNGESGYKGLHLDGSNNLVAWTADADASQWFIEPSDLTPAVPSAWETLQQAIAEAEAFKVSHPAGTSFGTYNHAAIDAALESAKKLSEGNLEALLVAATKALYDAIDSCPVNGLNAFIRIRATQENKPQRPYLTGHNSTVNTSRAAYTTEGDGAETILYYGSDKHLVAYENGYSLSDRSNFAGYNGVSGAGMTFDFAKVADKECFNVFFKDKTRALYCQTDGTNFYTDAGGSAGNNAGYQFDIEVVSALPVVVPATGYTTLYTPVALEVPETLTAYAVAVVDGKAEFTALAGNIPAMTAVVLEGEAGAYKLAVAAEAAPAIETALVGSVKAASVAQGAIYQLDVPAATGLGFYKNTATEVAGFVGYLAEADGAESVLLGKGTGIDSVPSAEKANVWYDLSGRRVENPANGIFINANGKKVLK